MGRVFIAPYKMGSESARALALALQCKRVNGKKIFKPNDVIINWGNSKVASVRGRAKIINNIGAIEQAANKLLTLVRLESAGVKCVKSCDNIYTAQQLLRQGNSLYARTKLCAHSGEGIIYLSPENGMWINAPLYTIAFPTDREYRVHVFNGKPIDVQQKRKREGVEVNKYIRNTANGWVFARENVTPPYAAYKESVKAVQALGLTFGAVDVLVDEDNNVAVCEVNTAPGLQGTTLDNYVYAIKEMMYGNGSLYQR